MGSLCRLERLSKKLAPGANSGEKDAWCSVADQIGNECFHPLRLALGFSCRVALMRPFHPIEHQIAVSMTKPAVLVRS